MLFKDKFYSVISNECEDNRYTFKVEIDPSHVIFNGHFPGNPVTPGVVQMEMVKELTGLALSCTPTLVKMPNCKFLAILNPETDGKFDIELTITDYEDNSKKVNAVFKNEQNLFLKMTAIYSVS